MEWIREHKNIIMITCLAIIAVLVVFIVLSMTRIADLQANVQTHMERVSILDQNVTEYEAEIELYKGTEQELVLLRAEVDALKEEIIELSLANEESGADMDDLIATNEDLTEKNKELAAAKSELERQNGELTKKLNGLKPN